MLKSIRRWWSAFTQPGTGGLIQPGDWRCVYPDGNRTGFMSHGDAKNMQENFGGRLEWRNDIAVVDARNAAAAIANMTGATDELP